jgi:hypothetical protein
VWRESHFHRDRRLRTLRFNEIISRVTGITAGPFGITWEPAPSEIEFARRVIAFLEDRRVLYAPGELQVPSYCSKSVLEIRTYLTTEVGKLDEKSELAKILKAMRAACRKFLDFEQTQRNWESFDPTFSGALGELRGVFGIHIALIAVKYKLDVEDDLASILPGEDEAKS